MLAKMSNNMEQEKIQKTLEALAKSGITVAGDLVLEKQRLSRNGYV